MLELEHGVYNTNNSSMSDAYEVKNTINKETYCYICRQSDPLFIGGKFDVALWKYLPETSKSICLRCRDKIAFQKKFLITIPILDNLNLINRKHW